MELQILIFIALIQGLVGREVCNDMFEKCSIELKKVLIPWNAQQLHDSCTHLQNYFSCEKRSELLSPVDNVCSYVWFVDQSEDLVAELCDPATVLHRDYIASASCFKSVGTNMSACAGQAVVVYDEYLRILRSTPNIIAPPTGHQQLCMKTLNQLVCLTDKIATTCGPVAEDVFFTVLSLSNYNYWHCTDDMIEEAHEAFKMVADQQAKRRNFPYTLKDLLTVEYA